MTLADGSRDVVDRRAIRTLGDVHDVPFRAKSTLYANGSDRNLVNELIDRGFLKESPVEFSNRRNISITERGRVLYDTLLVTQTIWESDPGADLDFHVSGGPSREDVEKTSAETPLESTNETSEVSESLPTEKVPQTGGNEVPSAEEPPSTPEDSDKAEASEDSEGADPGAGETSDSEPVDAPSEPAEPEEVLRIGGGAEDAQDVPKEASE